MPTIRYVGGLLGGTTEYVTELPPVRRVPVLLDTPRIVSSSATLSTPPRVNYGEDVYRKEGRGMVGDEYIYRYIRPDLERKNEELKRQAHRAEERAGELAEELAAVRAEAEIDAEFSNEQADRIAHLLDAIQILAAEIGR